LTINDLRITSNCLLQFATVFATVWLMESLTKPTETVRNTRYQYQPVLDGRKAKIRGLWKRLDTFYARLTVIDLNTSTKELRWIKLEMPDPATGGTRLCQTVAEAREAMNKLKVKRADNDLPVLKQTPKFTDYVTTYLDSYENEASTKVTEKVHLDAWIRLGLGEMRLNQITKPMIITIRDKRRKEVGNRSINLAMTCLRNVLHKAINDGWLQRMPTENIDPLDVIQPKKRLVPLESMKKVCDAAFELNLKNAIQFKDLIMFLCYSGGRISESLKLKWQDVDWTQRHVTFGYDGRIKSKKHRVVDFNSKLEAHLKDMQSRKAPDSDYVFPSAQRGKADKQAKSFRATLNKARIKAGLPKFGFHDCRHFFASMCAMSDVAKDVVRDWMGHSTTQLLDDVYVHYCRDYHAKQAAKVRFEPVVLAA
jgi:integrase